MALQNEICSKCNTPHHPRADCISTPENKKGCCNICINYVGWNALHAECECHLPPHVNESNIPWRVANQDLLRPPKKEEPKLKFDDAWANIEEEFEEKFNDVMGLETDPHGRKNMYLIRDQDDIVQHGIDFDDERYELKLFLKKHIEAAEQRGKEAEAIAHTKEDMDAYKAGAEMMKAKARELVKKLRYEPYRDTKGETSYARKSSPPGKGVKSPLGAISYNKALEDLSNQLTALSLTETQNG